MHEPNTRSRLGRIATALGVAATLVMGAAPAQALLIPGFVENRGQDDPRVAFTAQTAHGTVYVTHAREIVYVVPEPDELVAPTDGATGRAAKPLDRAASAGRARQAGSVADVRAATRPEAPWPTDGVGLDLRSRGRDRPAPRRLLALYETVVGAGAGAIRGLDRQPTAVQYFIGNDPAGWLVDVPVYARLDLGEVAPGIRLGLHVRNRGVEKVFTVAPGAALAALRLRLDGAAGVERGTTARLELLTDTGRLAFTRPKAWQLDDARRRVPVSVGYHVAGETYGFVTGPYDPIRPLFIDPLMASTYLGGVYDDEARDVAVGATGEVFVMGEITPGCFPFVPGGYDPVYRPSQMFVARLDPDLTTLGALTYIGGTWGDYPKRIALGQDGAVVIAGESVSRDFPVTANAFQGECPTEPGYGGKVCAVVAVFSRDLRRLRASTFLGGTMDEDVGALRADGTGQILLAGSTASRVFPTTAEAFMPTEPPIQDSGWNAFVSRLSPDLTTLVASTYFGGGRAEAAYALAIDAEGDVFIAGDTFSNNMPTTEGAFDRVRQYQEGFIARFDPMLTTLVAGTFLGGPHSDGVRALALDGRGRLYCAGGALFDGFPVTPGAFSTTPVDDEQPFIAALDTGLTQLHAATYLHAPGGEARGASRGLHIDPLDGTVTWVGQAWSAGFPIPADAYETVFGSSDIAVVIVRMSRDLAAVEAATFLGDRSCGDEGPYGSQVLDDGSVSLAGYTCQNFPTTLGAFQPSRGGQYDGFVSHLSRDLLADPPCPRNGDVDADGRITAADAQRAWAFALGFARPSFTERCAADCNADGRITAGDAQGVHAAALGAGSCADALPPQ